jgi:hypothetical protein
MSLSRCSDFEREWKNRILYVPHLRMPGILIVVNKLQVIDSSTPEKWFPQ